MIKSELAAWRATATVRAGLRGGAGPRFQISTPNSGSSQAPFVDAGGWDLSAAAAGAWGRGWDVRAWRAGTCAAAPRAPPSVGRWKSSATSRDPLGYSLRISAEVPRPAGEAGGPSRGP